LMVIIPLAKIAGAESFGWYSDTGTNATFSK
jgi:hypothetical protein